MSAVQFGVAAPVVAPLAEPIEAVNPTERELDEALAALDPALIDIPDHRNLALDAPILARIKSFNAEMRKLERVMEGRAENDPIRVAIYARYNKLNEEKIGYIQRNVPSADQVYAMSIPRILRGATDIFTANTLAKIRRILFDEGFSRFADPSLPATGYAPGFVATGRFGMNEMGETGHYFSKGEVNTYLNRESIGLRCSLRADQEGTAIMPVPELRTAGFTEAQIEQGYQRLQRDYPFLQNDGLPPKDTEIVYINPAGNLSVDRIVVGDDPDDIRWTGTPQQYWEDILEGDGDLPPLHPSWNGVAVRQVAAVQAPVQVVEAAPQQDVGQGQAEAPA